MVIIPALLVSVKPLWRGTLDLTRRQDWKWSGVISGILVIGRWPILVFPRELNPDECQLFAGAHTLARDPVFWRSVDGSTAGPLDFFALCPAGFLLGWDNYLSARLTALAVVAISLIFVHQSLSLLAGRHLARIATLGSVCLEALTNSMDLLHYSTELVSIALLSGAIYACVRRWVTEGGPYWGVTAGAALGAIPLAKLQAAPLAFCLGLGWVIAELVTRKPDRWRRAGWLCLGAVLPVLLFSWQLTIAGEWEHALTPYILNNLHYSRIGSSSVGDTAKQLLDYSLAQDSLLHLWLPGMAVWLIAMLRLRKAADSQLLIFTGIFAAGVVISLYSIYHPGRAFLHYCQLLVVPLTLLLGAVAALLLTSSPEAGRRREQRLVVCGLLLVLIPLLAGRVASVNFALRPEDAFGNEHLPALGRLVKTHARDGDRLAVWGWSNYLYVETGLAQATRDPHIEKVAQPGPYQQYFIRVYLEDFLRSQPAFFVDSIGQYSVRFQEEQYAHDRFFPALAAVVRQNYVLIGRIDTARVYQRKDLLNR